MTIDEKLIRAPKHVWEGIVSIFDGAPAPGYAWAVNGEKGPQYIAVKGGGCIDSPLPAVCAWLVSQ